MTTLLSPSGIGIEVSVSWISNSAHDISVVDSYIPVGEHYSFDFVANAYVGRALYNSEWCPGYFTMNALSSKEPSGLHLTQVDNCDTVENYQILIDTSIKTFMGPTLSWKQWQAVDEVPKNALVAGSHQGTPIFYARTNSTNGNLIGGSFIPSDRRAVFNSENKLIIKKKEFEVLILTGRELHPDYIDGTFTSPY